MPAVVDLAAMRDAMAALGGDPARINPLVPGRPGHRPLASRSTASARADAFAFNVDREYERNGERYQLLRWAQTAFSGPARRAARHGHRPPGQPRVPRAGRPGRASDADGTTGRLPGHARGHRLAHHDDQRPGRPGLRRRRHRGRGRPARPAALPADAAASSACACTASCRAAPPPRTSCWSSARCCASTAWSARSSSSRATASRRWRWPTGRRSPTCRPSTAPRPRCSRSTTRRSPTCA